MAEPTDEEFEDDDSEEITEDEAADYRNAVHENRRRRARGEVLRSVFDDE